MGKSFNEVNKAGSGITWNILFVEDEPDTLSVVERGLTNCGLKVTPYNKPLEAIDNFKAGKFDLLLTDIQMSQMNGYDLYRKLHSIDAQLKVCFLTGHNEYTQEFRRFFPEMDEKCFVNKPISISHLADRILAIIES